jgi:hypothetical protein
MAAAGSLERRISAATAGQAAADDDLDALSRPILTRRKDFIDKDEEARKSPNRVLYFRRNADYDRLIEACGRKLRDNPRNVRALLIRASSYSKKGAEGARTEAAGAGRRCGRRTALPHAPTRGVAADPRVPLVATAWRPRRRRTHRGPRWPPVTPLTPPLPDPAAPSPGPARLPPRGARRLQLGAAPRAAQRGRAVPPRHGAGEAGLPGRRDPGLLRGPHPRPQPRKGGVRARRVPQPQGGVLRGHRCAPAAAAAAAGARRETAAGGGGARGGTQQWLLRAARGSAARGVPPSRSGSSSDGMLWSGLIRSI